MSWAEKRRFAVAALLFLALATQTALGSYGQAAGVLITSVSLVAGAVLLRNRQWEPVALLAARSDDAVRVPLRRIQRPDHGRPGRRCSCPGWPQPLWSGLCGVVTTRRAISIRAVGAPLVAARPRRGTRRRNGFARPAGLAASVHHPRRPRWMAGSRPLGANDYSPAVLVVLGLIVLRTNRYAGGCLLAAAAALKPYAFAWFVPATGFGGVAAAVALVSTTVVLWTPVLFVWGVASFLESIRQASALPHHVAGTHSLNMPALRILALPLEIAGLWTRRWKYCLLIGSGVFIIVMFLAQWATYSYWIAVIPPTGLALESLWQGQFEERRRNSS